MVVITWAWTGRNAVLLLSAEDMGFSIITEFAAVFVGARSVVRISCHYRPALILAEIISRVTYLRNLICFFVLILTGTWAIRSAVLVLGPEHVRLCIVTKSMWVVVLSRSVIRLGFLWGSASTVAKIPCWTSLVYGPISSLVLVVSWARPVSDALVSFAAKNMS